MVSTVKEGKLFNLMQDVMCLLMCTNVTPSDIQCFIILNTEGGVTESSTLTPKDPFVQSKTKYLC